MKRSLILLYGVACYSVFFATFLYAIAWMGNFFVPNSLDSEPSTSLGVAIAVNLGLLLVFAVQHSLMARPFFKKWLTKAIPEPAERSTYVLASSLAMILMFLFWQPMGGHIWSTTNPVLMGILYTIYFGGWVTIFLVTCLINHFDLFGLRQTWLYFRGREYTPLKFVTPGPYKMIRHPLYIGWLMTIWATPIMTAGHLLFAIGTTGYILTAIRFEERDLENSLGIAYTEYRNRVPMLVPRLGREKPDLESGIHRI